MSQVPHPEQERLLEVPEGDDRLDPAAEEDFALSVVLEDDEVPFDFAPIDLGDLDPEPFQEPTIHVDLTTIEAEHARAAEMDVDLPVPPRPGGDDRFLRLQTAGQAMRQGIREEIQTASNQIFSLAVEQVRTELDAEVRRFQDDIRREVEALKEDLRTREAQEGFSVLEVERRLAELAELVTETRDAVLGLKKRYLPGSTPSSGS